MKILVSTSSDISDDRIREQFFTELKKRIRDHAAKEVGPAFKADTERFIRLYQGIDKRMKTTEHGQRTAPCHVMDIVPSQSHEMKNVEKIRFTI